LQSELQKAINSLRERLLLLGAQVEENLAMAAKALTEADPGLATRVMKKDRTIDRLEIEVEEECLRIMALYQPVAGDLRFLVTVLKINNDLERIGDLAKKIADKVRLVAGNPESRERMRTLSLGFREMFERTISMVHDSLDAFVDEDADLAYRVCLSDDEVDRDKMAIRDEIERILSAAPDEYVFLAKLMSVSRCLERIADHSTNICEDIIYMLQGRIVRHRIEKEP